MFDSHAHVAFSQFDDDRDNVIQRAWDAGLTGWIEVGTDLEQSKKAIELAEQYDNIWATVGVHPSDIPKIFPLTKGEQKGVWKKIEGLIQHPKVRAVGEVGLDYYRGGTKEEQMPVLKQFIAFAQKRDLPVIFHVRDPVKPRRGRDHGASANEDMIKLLKSYSDTDRPRGVMHTFSGTREQAQRYIELGMYLGFSGVVTFKNTGELIEVTKEIPSDRILIETDCPFLAPEPHRGERNEPAHVKYVAQKIAELRGVTEGEVRSVTEKNTRELFRL